MLSSLALASLWGQELDGLGNKKPLDLSGGFSLQSIYRQDPMGTNSSGPLSTVVQANLNLSLFGWTMPFSGSWSDKKWGYQQPFNRFSLHPSWKWIRTQIGDAGMSFSPYSLNGHSFTGAGIEAEPGEHWKFSCMAGRLLKRNTGDSLNPQQNNYSRIGYGWKAGYIANSFSLENSVVYVADEKNSLHTIEDTLKPAALGNLLFTIRGAASVAEKWNLSGELGTSLYNPGLTDSTSGSMYGIPVPGRNPKNETHHALKFGLDYQSPAGGWNLGYERIAPGYVNLASYYMLNDVEIYSLTYRGSWWNKKLQTGITGGWQKDDLRNTKNQQNRRLANSISLVFSPTEKWNATAQYSGFSHYVNVRKSFNEMQPDQVLGILDTLDFTQLTESFSGSVQYTLGGREHSTSSKEENSMGDGVASGNADNNRREKKPQHRIGMMVNMQKASQIQSDNPGDAGSRFMQASCSYHLSVPARQIQTSMMIQFSGSKLGDAQNLQWGPVWSFRKGFPGKKLSLHGSLHRNESIVTKEKTGRIMAGRLGWSYRQGQHNLDMQCTLCRKNQLSRRSENWMLSLQYSFAFGK